MPKFTLIKHPQNDFDSEVTVTFDTDLLGTAQGHFDDFLKASGFELPLETEDKMTPDEFLQRSEDWAWSDAFASKFRNDGVDGSAGSDVIKFPSRY